MFVPDVCICLICYLCISNENLWLDINTTLISKCILEVVSIIKFSIRARSNSSPHSKNFVEIISETERPVFTPKMCVKTGRW